MENLSNPSKIIEMHSILMHPLQIQIRTDSESNMVGSIYNTLSDSDCYCQRLKYRISGKGSIASSYKETKGNFKFDLDRPLEDRPLLIKKVH